MHFRWVLAFAWLLPLVAARGAQVPAAQPKIADLQARFDKETNSGQKEKLFVKLSDAQFAEAHRAAHEDDFQTVGFQMEKYRDNVRTALEALRDQHPNAEKHAGPFRNLEMHVREGLRELEDFLIVAPPEYKPPLELVQGDINKMEDDLLHLLFPRRPGEKPPAHPPPKKE